MTFQYLAGEVDVDLDWIIDEDFEMTPKDLFEEYDMRNDSTSRLKLLFDTYPYLQTLYVMQQMVDEYAQSLAEYLKSNYKLKELFLNLTYLGQDSTLLVLNSILGHPSLELLLLMFELRGDA